MYQGKLQLVFGLVLCLIMALVAVVVVAQDDDSTVLKQDVGAVSSFTVEIPEDGWLYMQDEDGSIFITNSERLLPPEDAGDDYETPVPMSGESYLDFLPITQSTLEALQFIPDGEATGEAFAHHLRDLLSRAVVNEENIEISEVEVIQIGEHNVAKFYRRDTDVERTFMIFELNPPLEEFLWVTVVHAPTEFDEENVFALLETITYEAGEVGSVEIVSATKQDSITRSGVGPCPPPQTGWCMSTSTHSFSNGDVWLVITLAGPNLDALPLGRAVIIDADGNRHASDAEKVDDAEIVFRWSPGDPDTGLELQIGDITLSFDVEN